MVLFLCHWIWYCCSSWAFLSRSFDRGISRPVCWLVHFQYWYHHRIEDAFVYQCLRNHWGCLCFDRIHKAFFLSGCTIYGDYLKCELIHTYAYWNTLQLRSRKLTYSISLQLCFETQACSNAFSLNIKKSKGLHSGNSNGWTSSLFLSSWVASRCVYKA